MINQPDAAQVQSERKTNTEQIPKLKMMYNVTENGDKSIPTKHASKSITNSNQLYKKKQTNNNFRPENETNKLKYNKSGKRNIKVCGVGVP